MLAVVEQVLALVYRRLVKVEAEHEGCAEACQHWVDEQLPRFDVDWREVLTKLVNRHLLLLLFTAKSALLTVDDVGCLIYGGLRFMRLAQILVLFVLKPLKKLYVLNLLRVRAQLAPLTFCHA